MPIRKHLTITLALSLLSAFLIVGCSSSEMATTPEKSEISAAPSEAALLVLSKADAADGTLDKIVTKCATCMLGMTGQPGNAVTYGEYTLHFCSQQCKEHFISQPEQVLLALEFPEE